MNFVALDIKMGLAGALRISDERLAFEEKVVRLLHPGETNITRLGLTQSSPFNYTHIASLPAYIGPLIENGINPFIRANGGFDLLLIDMSSNPYDLLRDPILFHLAEVLETLCTRRLCSSFILLLPQLPGPQMPSMLRFNSTKEKLDDYNLLILANTGDSLAIPNGQAPPDMSLRYKILLKELTENPESKLRKKLVRRLGHFRRAGRPQQCRLYSFVTDYCDEEFMVLLNTWWHANRITCDTILFDTKNNPSFTSSLRAFALKEKLSCHRVDDVVGDKRDRRLAREVAAKGPCMLVVDVVETGETLRKHLEALNGAGIEVHKTVLAAISKGGSNQTQVGTYNVSSFLSTSGIAPTDICPQCELGLPFTSDAAEGITRIRAYDMWYMANEVWWQHEPDVPDNVGEAYEFIPDYPVMLSKFGDWIAYKMEILLRAINHPQNMFVIHPDESGAISVSSRLRLRFDNQLIVVKVPRDAIKAAQSVGNAWDQILPHYSGDEWLALLNSLSQATALITDVFNGSGSTFFSIFSLLEQLDIKVFCYFPFVDRDCDPANSKKYPIQKYSLYEWYGPRQLKREGGTS